TLAGNERERWRALAEATGFERIVLGRQVHGSRVLWHDRAQRGFRLTGQCDGHATAVAGTLLAVSVADCVPVSIVDPERRAVALVHAGWRGVAGGVIEAGLLRLMERAGSYAGSLHVHLGPAICGECYEVGPEVHEALGLHAPVTPEPVDLRAIIARRVAMAGVRVENITRSAYCTRCGDSPFFSHRAGCAERQVGILGIVSGTR
ncbi:MAG TPA: polyphenol oxidase family protein, partial [Longimicrobiales bacterium]|nr:polyphenol oxidase family protein [Longimicrobiales bacterium]